MPSLLRSRVIEMRNRGSATEPADRQPGVARRHTLGADTHIRERRNSPARSKSYRDGDVPTIRAHATLASGVHATRARAIRGGANHPHDPTPRRARGPTWRELT